MPCSVFAFVKAEEASGSEFVGLLAALGLYAAVIAFIAFVFGKKNPPAR